MRSPGHPRLSSTSLACAALLLTTLAACETPPSGEGGETAETAGTAETGAPEPEPLTGYADLHLHMFAEEAFGGGWMAGSALGPAEVALAMCDGGGEGSDHARLRDGLGDLFTSCDPDLINELAPQVPFLFGLLNFGGLGISELLGDVPGTDGDTGVHADRTAGWPELSGWPSWDTIAHQQSWEGWLREAYDSGMRVEIISAVSFDFLCKGIPAENLKRPQCDEMDDVRVQLELANEFVAANEDWVEIALSAAEARRIVSEDKLAIILSIEASHIFGEGDWRAQLDEVYELGVRTLQPVHQLDNRFGGAAHHSTIFHIAQFEETCHVDTDCGATTPTLTLGFDVDENCRNVLGASEEGVELLTELMDRGMLIDMAHMSEQHVRDTYELAAARDYYPLYMSHAHFREIMTPTKAAQEKTTPAWVVKMVRETGGMIGLRTAHEEVNSYAGASTDNGCHGSSRSFAQAYEYGRLGLGVSIGLGSDFNGFIQQTRPRLGQGACSASFPEEAQCQARDERLAGAPGVGTDFDEIGLGHIGVLGDLIDDLDAHGVDTSELRSSADDFVRMWERAEGERSGKAEEVGELDTSGITILPSHFERLAEYPTECGDPYCPGALLPGEACRFDAECESGSCNGWSACGDPEGACD